MIPKARPDYKHQLSNIEYWYIEIETKTGIPQREIGFAIHNNAILFGPTAENKGFWTASNIIFDSNQYPKVDIEIFNDIFEALERHQLNVVKQKIEKYLQKWIDNNAMENMQFPSLIYDLTEYKKTVYIDCWNSFTDSDITGYEWDSSERIIDAKGKIYKTSYINFGHPVGCVYPEKIEDTISLENFKTMIKANFNKIKDKELNGQTFEELFAELIE